MSEIERKREQSGLSFDHVHLISEDPHSTASWYVDNLGGKVVQSAEVGGAPQIYVAFEGGNVTVRGRRPGENPAAKPGLQWGVDHFGFHIYQDFDEFCVRLKSSGVHFLMEPRDFGDQARVAYIQAPDAVKIELVFYKKQHPTEGDHTDSETWSGHCPPDGRL